MVQIDKESIIKHYESSTGYRKRVALLDFAVTPFNMWQWAAEQYSFANARNILEVGCGTGDFWRYGCKQLSNQHHLTLTDISPGMLQATQEALLELTLPCPVDLQIADVEQLNFAEKSFDCVLAHLMLYHAKSPTLALTGIKRVLKQNGWVGILSLARDTYHEVYTIVNQVDPRIPDHPYVIANFSEFTADEMLPKLFSQIKKYRQSIEIQVQDAEPLISTLRTHFIVQDYNLTESFFEACREKFTEMITTQGRFSFFFTYVLYICK